MGPSGDSGSGGSNENLRDDIWRQRMAWFDKRYGGGCGYRNAGVGARQMKAESPGVTDLLAVGRPIQNMQISSLSEAEEEKLLQRCNPRHDDHTTLPINAVFQQ